MAYCKTPPRLAHQVECYRNNLKNRFSHDGTKVVKPEELFKQKLLILYRVL